MTSLSKTESKSCCGGLAPAKSNACCVVDAKAKASGEHGCGCADQREEKQNGIQNSSCC